MQNSDEAAYQNADDAHSTVDGRFFIAMSTTMAFVDPNGAHAQWDSNFNQILSRTRDNISRISSRYDTADDTVAR